MDSEPPSEPQPSLFAVAPLLLIFGAMSIWSISLWILLLIVLIFLSAMYSSSEVAFFSLTAVDLENIANKDTKSSERLLLLKQKPRQLLATILVANNFVNIGIVILFDFILRHTLDIQFYSQVSDFFIDLLNISPSYQANVANSIEFITTVVIATSILMLFGEVLPKLYANVNNVKLALLLAKPLNVTQRFFYPVTHLLVKYSTVIENRLSKLNLVEETTSKGEIEKAIDLTVEQEKESLNILKRIVNFGEVTVKEIMKSRVDVVALDIELTFAEIIDIIRDSGYSRFPVYKEDFDNIQGMLYAKDLLVHINSDSTFNWQSLVRKEVKYVPEGKNISDLIKEIQAERKHLAVVVDEFGGSAGIVTLEDIMEEVIGDIKDEFDDENELDYEKLDEFNYIFEGKTHISDLCRLLDLERETFDDFRGDNDSIAGLMLEVYGRIPKKNSQIKIHGYNFSVHAVNNRRIEKVQITLPS